MRDAVFEGLKIGVLIGIALILLSILVELKRLEEKGTPLQVTKCEVIGSRG